MLAVYEHGCSLVMMCYHMGKRMFPIFSSIGCPYRCSFCLHPTVYRVINGPKWRPYDDEEVVDHIDHVTRTFRVDHICFIDDTSFPNIPRMGRIFERIIERGIKVTLEFRGARINEIDRMDDDFLRLMVKAGEYDCSDYLHLHVIPTGNHKLRHGITSPSLAGNGMSEAWQTVLKLPNRYLVISPMALLGSNKKVGNDQAIHKYLSKRYGSETFV